MRASSLRTTSTARRAIPEGQSEAERELAIYDGDRELVRVVDDKTDSIRGAQNSCRPIELPLEQPEPTSHLSVARGLGRCLASNGCRAGHLHYIQLVIVYMYTCMYIYIYIYI